MSDNLKAQLPKLEVIGNLKSLSSRLALLKEYSRDKKFCRAIREIVRNALKKNIRFSQSERAKLLKYKKLILSLGEKQKSKKKLRSLVQQTGTGVFLPIAIPLVVEIIRRITA